MNRYICIHGHFYQPPRENPWTNRIESQPSAGPYPNWNERITDECYRPNIKSEIPREKALVKEFVNNYAHMSFNFGPTLLSWLQEFAPDVYLNILAADRESQRKFQGHGSAIAQVYNHMIMPLANYRDKRTQVIWGIRDFEVRFNRRPEGMWLPEAAVDVQTLEALAENGMLFTILSPHQMQSVRKIGEGDWQSPDDRTNIRQPFLCCLPSGKTINLFFYDGAIAQDIAFGHLLKSGKRYANRLVSAFSDEDSSDQLVSVATDGETYGHHKTFTEMALSYCIDFVQTHQLAELTNFGNFLAQHPPQWEVEILENTSWSCPHGISRWMDDCGCHVNKSKGTQAWRKPLREALDLLRDHLAHLYEREMNGFSLDPWELRDQYIDVLLGLPTSLSDQPQQTLQLLEMQRFAMLMYTSCGWFFDDIAGIEAVQILQYAARAMELAEEITSESFERRFLEKLRNAPTNHPEYPTGEDVFNQFCKEQTGVR